MIRIDLDRDRQLADYRLTRLVDRKAIAGDTALLLLLRDLTVTQILVLDAATVRQREADSSSAAASLNLKHLFSIQATLQVWNERLTPVDSDPCRITQVVCRNGQTRIEAEINLNQIAANIIATGNFRGG